MEVLRAVIYCRCSTEEESQVDALKKQVKESEDCVAAQGWYLADRYVESKSGTTTRGRGEYNRLFEDLSEDRFDVIVIKSQDRLMRNVRDWYLFLDRMVKQKKRLFMYMEQKFYTTDDALITGIKAIMAEEYSRELSKKINHAHRRRQISGGRAMLTSRVFGFQKNPDGSLEVEEEEAEVIRKIYEYCAAGYGSRAIANMFLNQGYRKRTGKALRATDVGRIIRNPLYRGTMVMNRFHYDFETKRMLKVPREQWIYGEGIVPAIVDGQLWERANQKMSERANGKAPEQEKRKSPEQAEVSCRIGADKRCEKIAAEMEGAEASCGDEVDERGRNPGVCELSGKLVCGQCGRPYYRTRRHGCGNRERVIIEWKCSNYLERGRKTGSRNKRKEGGQEEGGGGCDNVHLDEGIVFTLLEQISSWYYDFRRQDRDEIVNHGIRVLQKALERKPEEGEWTRLEQEEERLWGQKDFLLKKFLEQVISDQDYQKKNGELEKGIAEIQQQKEDFRQRRRKIQNVEQRIEKIKAWMEKGGVEKAMAAGMLQDIREIRVEEWQLEICFDPLRAAGQRREKRREGNLAGELWDENFVIKVDYPFAPETKRGRYLDRRQIVTLLKDNPQETARSLAEVMGRSVTMVRNRMEELTKGGYIRFDGRGGRGVWEILKELPDKQVSIREEGL